MSKPIDREEDLFLQALNISAAERAAFLDKGCGSDAQLRARLDELLLAHERSVGPLDKRPLCGEPQETAEHFASTPGTVIAGRYKLLEEIGEGGMGTVWVAQQTEPVVRKVALKLVKPGMDSRQVIARFNAERQALALMDHPNIAKVFDGGLTEHGRPYFVMEYVKGVPFTEYCDHAKLPLRERLALFVQACQAVQHAHQKGIIHRDLKPSNILACLYDGKPVLKVIDFGLAKAMYQPLTDQTLHTAHGMMLGTPLYMSPEQAEFNNLDVDTRTDIYSLGVILYELLTGSTPLEKQQLKAAAYNEILRLIKEVEPPKPSTRLSGSATLPGIAAQRNLEPHQLRRSLRGELDWIVMKALDKERSRRYETANGLARDIERYLCEEPVEACPPSKSYRLKKFALKNRLALLVATTFATVIVLSSIAVGWWATEAIKQQRIAEFEKQEATNAKDNEILAHSETRRQRYSDLINLSYEAWNVGDLVRSERLLSEAEKIGQSRSFECSLLRGLQNVNAPTDSYLFEDIVTSVAQSLNGEVAVGLGNGAILLRRSGSERFVVLNSQMDVFADHNHSRDFSDVSFTKDGSLLIAACPTNVGGVVRSWKINSNECISLVQHPGNPTSLAVSPSDVMGVSGDSEGVIKAWDIHTGAILWERDEDSTVQDIEFSPDGEKLAVGCDDGKIFVVDPSSGTTVAESATNPVQSLAFSADGKSLIVADDHHVRLWQNNETSSLVPTLQVIQTRGWDLDLSPDGEHFAVVGPDTILRIWHLSDWTESKRYMMPHAGTSVLFSRDGVMAGSLDMNVHTWKYDGTLNNEIRGMVEYIQALDVGTGRDIITARDRDNSVVYWNQYDAPVPLYKHDSVVQFVGYSPDRRLIMSGDEEGTVRIYDTRVKKELQSWNHIGAARSISCSKDGLLIASAGKDGVFVKGEDFKTRFTLHHRGRAMATAFSPDGRYLATGGGTYWSFGESKVWDIAKEEPELVFEFEHPNIVLKTLFSPDGKSLAVIDEFIQGSIHVWDVPSFTRRLELKCHNRQTSAIDFLPDSSRLVTASADGTVRFWDTTTGARVGSLTVNEQVRELKVFEDGNGFATASSEGIVRVWRASP